MFRRRWSGLPADPIFAPDLQELGYFINDIDEIRSIEDSDYYFKFFLTKNDRWNERQRFAFNEAVTKVIHARLTTAGFTRVPLPLGTPPTQPHVPILLSRAIATKSRVVLLFGESCQSLGVLAHRVIGGRGGVTRGSVLGFIDGLAAQASSAMDPSPPGVVLANAGELWWWPEGGRGLTPVERHRVPMASAVHFGRYHDPKVNEVPGHRTVAEHVRGVFEAVVLGGGSGSVGEGAKVDVVVVGDTADEVKEYLDDEAVWERVGGRLGCLVVMGGVYSSKKFKCGGFKKFMEERGRAYLIHHTPLDNPVAGPGGNPGVMGFTSYGCPVYSAGEAKVTETILIDAQPAVLKWIQQVALKGEAYKNEAVEVFGDEGCVTSEEIDSPWGAPEADAAQDNETSQKADDKADDAVLGGKNGEASAPEKGGKARDDKVEGHGRTAQATEDSTPKVSIDSDGGKSGGSSTETNDTDSRTKQTSNLKKVENLEAEHETLKVQEDELRASMEDLLVQEEEALADVKDFVAELEDPRGAEEEVMADMADRLSH